MKNLKNLDELNRALAKLGENRRELSIAKAELDEQIANLQKAYAPMISNLDKENEELNKQIIAFCYANFQQVFKNGLKTAKLLTGEIQRKAKPNSIVVEDLELAMQKIKELGWTRFIRTKEELNKNALLSEPQLVAEIEGLDLMQGMESLIIKPYQSN